MKKAACIILLILVAGIVLWLTAYRPVLPEQVAAFAVDAALKVRGDFGGNFQIIDPGRWEPALPGLEIRTLRLGREKDLASFKLQAVRVSPSEFAIEVIRLTPKESSRMRPAEIMASRNALALINGPFFDHMEQSLGLLVIDGRVINKKPRRGADAIFFVKDGRPRIATREDFPHTDVDFAIQTGPWLVRDGARIEGFQRPWLVDRRSALGLDAQGRLLLAVTDAAINGLSLYELSHLLARPESGGGLGCVDAVNLDGGTSTQMMLSAGDARIRVRGFKRVPVFLLVVKKR